MRKGVAVRERGDLTDPPKTSAVELYRSCGFTEVGSDGADTQVVIPSLILRAFTRAKACPIPPAERGG